MSEKLEILDLIEKGEISPEEGARRLQELAGLTEDQADQPSTQLEILGMIERGEISTDEAVQRLADAPPSIVPAQPAADSGPTIRELPPEMKSQIRKWQNWWMIPAWIGIALILLSGWWMSSSFQNAGGVNFWFFFAWLPMALGILLAWLSWPSPNRTWLHVRVQEDREDHKQRVNISMPLPIKLASWGFRTFKHHIPDDVRDKLDESSVDEIITALGSTAAQGTPFYVQVEEDDGSEIVEVFIG